MSTAIVTDSNSQISAELVTRYGITVVPISVMVDGVEYLEGVEIDADRFYEFFESGAPEVTTSQPSPGRFADTYKLLAEAGHHEIVSVHVTESMSGTLNSARIGSADSPVPVHLVDSRTASFGVACCAWEVGEALSCGGSVDDAIARATSLADRLSSVTALGASELFRSGGRVEGVSFSTEGIDVFRADPDGSFVSVGVGRTPDEICDLMAETMHSGGAPIRVALGVADESAAPYYDGLEARLGARDDVVEIVRYRIGPSVGAFTGPGAAGGFWYTV